MMKVLTLVLVLGATTAPAAAQVGPPISRVIPVIFSGVVTNDVTNEIRIRQPNGTFAPFVGPVPDYPYKVGDPITVSFNATVPTKEAFAVGAIYNSQLSADGIYRFSVGTQGGAASGGFTPPGGIGLISNPDVSGPITPNANRLPTSVRMTLVYDANADSYSLEFPNGSWSMFGMNGPSYVYNPDTGAMTNASLSCPGRTGCTEFDTGGFTVTGNATGGSAANIGVFTPPNSSYQGGLAGVFSLLFSGAWNLPTYGSGGSTQVPEPGMMLLFGGGAAALVRRWSRAKAKLS